MDFSQEEFAAAVTEHSRRMYRAARSVLDSDADAEDAVSQAVLQAWQSLDKLRDTETVSAKLTDGSIVEVPLGGCAACSFLPMMRTAAGL